MILLTDLVDYHKVAFIEMSDQEELLGYTIQTFQFPSFTHEIDYTKENLLTRLGLREGCPSPPSSIVHVGFAIPGSFASLKKSAIAMTTNFQVA